MFAYQAGESLDASSGKTLLRTHARERWSFLTPIDLTMIQSEQQLAATVRIRSGISDAQSTSDVRDWLGEQEIASRPPGAGQGAAEKDGRTRDPG